MSKRPSLFAAPANAAAPSSPVAGGVAPTETPPKVVPGDEPAPDKAKRRPPSREGKRVVSVYVSEEAYKQLRMLGLQVDASTQALGEEAFNLLFEKHRLNRIA